MKVNCFIELKVQSSDRQELASSNPCSPIGVAGVRQGVRGKISLPRWPPATSLHVLETAQTTVAWNSCRWGKPQIPKSTIFCPLLNQTRGELLPGPEEAFWSQHRLCVDMHGLCRFENASSPDQSYALVRLGRLEVGASSCIFRC